MILGEILLGTHKVNTPAGFCSGTIFAKTPSCVLGGNPAVGLSARLTGAQVDDLGVGETVKCGRCKTALCRWI